MLTVTVTLSYPASIWKFEGAVREMLATPPGALGVNTTLFDESLPLNVTFIGLIVPAAVLLLPIGT